MKSKTILPGDGDYIGLDVGEKNIGVARVNTVVGIAEPLDPISYDPESVFDKVKDLIKNYQIIGVVIGLPRGLDGQETTQTEFCRQFAKKLADNIPSTVFMIDEAGSTKAAELRKTAYPKASIDSIAASVFLEDFVNCKDRESLLIKHG